MKVQIGDVWETDGNTREIFCSWDARDGFTRFGYRWEGDSRQGMGEGDAERVMRDGATLIKRSNINRPGAGGRCSLEDCLLFGIGTKEEWEAAPKEDLCATKYDKILPHAILDSDGKLPKVEEKEEPNGYVDVVPIECNGRQMRVNHMFMTKLLSNASDIIGFMGYVWVVNGNEVLNFSSVLWRDENGILHYEGDVGRTIEYCKAVRFKC